MAERTVTISSLGKTFSVTGWKAGWVLARPHLLDPIFRVHQFVTFAGAAPLQATAATALGVGDQYYRELAAAYLARRDYLVDALRAAGIHATVICSFVRGESVLVEGGRRMPLEPPGTDELYRLF
jgi:N-succinyldiaminopimelate aminotransferase